ncbi:MAG TPA: GAF domain-containing SpoIIE family protein phosphatase [Solirubrobacteraceae bacterium]|nr:GAF domain-containing SpoIIE family protein phosphatase [Solirubrobacteraceae bacterium]
MEGGAPTGTDRRHAQQLLARLWAVLDPAVDALPAGEVLEHVLERLIEHFGVTAATLRLDSGERFGTHAGDPAWPAAAERLELEVQDGLGAIGTLELAFSDPGQRSQEERATLELAAARLGRSVARLRQERETAVAEAGLRAENRAAGRLYRVSTALMAQRDLKDVVQRVTEESTALSGAQFGAFFYNVLDARGESYMLYTIAGVPRSAFERFPMPRNTAVFNPTFQGEGVVRSDDITADARYGRSAPYHGMPEGHLPVRSYLAVPVRARDGEVLGGLFFGHAQFGVFDEDAERLVVAVAALAALAIENARLHDTARRELDASRQAYLERDHVARVLQESLLPPRLPGIAGLELAARYEPGAGMVGGDFYDVFAIGAAAFGAAIGDVQGKDARAAAMTSVVRHSLRSSAQTHEPSAALALVNQVVLQEQEPSDPRFSSAALARLERDGDAFRVRISSAGHTPALVVRADGAVAECHESGTLLGISDEPDLATAETTLAPGDTLVLYTDGLTEARSAEDILGEQRVHALLAEHAGASAAELTDRLGELAMSFSARRRDDLALLVARVTG